MTIVPSWRSAEPLDVAGIQTLTQQAFPTEFYEDEEGLLELPSEDWNNLSRYFQFFGLRLPQDAHAQTTHDLWRGLQLTYAPLVRLASRGSRDHPLMAKATPEQREYALAVGLQNLPLAQTRARMLFTGKHESLFLV